MDTQMNDPSDTTDEDLLHDLEEEFMDLAKAGDRRAFFFAIAYSDDFCLASTEFLMRLTPPALEDPISLNSCIRQAVVSIAGVEYLMEIFEKVAPAWAAQELPKRIAEMKPAHEECMGEPI